MPVCAASFWAGAVHETLVSKEALISHTTIPFCFC